MKVYTMEESKEAILDWSDQYENLDRHTQKGVEFSQRVVHFYQERCAIESEYASKLKKLVKNYQPKKKDEDDVLTATKGFAEMLKEIHDLAGQHEIIAESVQGDIIKELQTVITDVKQERKKHLQECVRLQNLMKTQLDTLERSKKKYEKAHFELEKSQDAYKKADADMSLSRTEVEKTRQVSIKKGQEYDESKNEYASVLVNTNQYQTEHYTRHMPDTFQLLQQMDEKRTTKVGEYIMKTAEIEDKVIPIISNCIAGIRKAGNSINAQQDTQLVIDKYKSGFTIPEDLPFEDLTSESGSVHDVSTNSTPRPAIMNNTSSRGTQNSKKPKRTGLFGIFGSKGDEQKEDFSDLPPNQRKKKLNQKIDIINKEIAKETGEREAILKMQTVYKDNPTMGDASSLDKKIEENAQKLDDLQQRLRKYQNYLSEAEGKSKRHSMSEDSMSRSASECSVQAPNNTSAPGTPVQPHHYSHIEDGKNGRAVVVDYNNRHSNKSHLSDNSTDIAYADQDSFDEVEYDSMPVVGTARAIYSFDPTNDVSVPISEFEEMSILEIDEGDGWTRVRKTNGLEGWGWIRCSIVPQPSYLPPPKRRREIRRLRDDATPYPPPN